MFNKKGVSLITVLLFMLVATIAATATFKWLTSENRSSASRMEIQESRQSAIAGIQATRAWMTNNANDVGALVRQYVLGGKQPILLNNRVVAHMNNRQDFNVWLTGISETNGRYKFKILSEGKARQSSKHTEVAILDVSGLYQVAPPVEPEKRRRLDFDYSYFGSTVRNDGKIKVSSMIINGNWHGNPNTVDRNIVITGKARLSGDEIKILGTGCIGGDLYADNGIEAKNLYVHGTSRDFGTKNESSKMGISRHAYFDGIVEHSSNGDKKIYVGGNLTVKNLFKTHMGSGSASVTVDGNLCVDSAISQIQLGASQKAPAFVYNWTPSYNVPFTVRKNVYVTHPRAFYAKSGDFSENYTKLILGDSSSSKLYIPDAYHSSNYTGLRASFPDAFVDVSSSDNKYYFYVYPSDPSSVKAGTNYEYGDANVNKTSPYCNASDNPSCHVTPWFFSRASSENIFQREPSEPFDFVRDVDCADSVKKVCDAIWTKKEGCDGAEFKVDDILVTAYEKFIDYANKCVGITTLDDEEFVSKMNSCYDTLPEAKLYNGYVVVKVTASQKNDYKDKAGSIQKLNGKFIIIITNKPYNGELNLPPTKDDNDFVFLYLTQGTGKNVTINGIDDQRYNYFIYTKSNVGESATSPTWNGPEITPYGGFLFNNAEFHGSIYAAAETCAKISRINNAKPLVFNQALLDDLSQNQVICPAPDFTEENCGGAATSSSSAGPESSSSVSGDDLIGGKDPYFISIAPQLNVSLESQYKATESAPAENAESSTVEGSILVMPRIIYLSRTPTGRLQDYYSVLNLNGAHETKTPSRVSCNGSVPATGKLYDGTPLDVGNYKCEYTSPNYGTVPFYVVVSNVSVDDAVVKFNEPTETTLGINDEATISVHIGKSSNASGKIKFDISIDREIAGWTITPLAGVTRRDSSSGSRLYYTVEVTPNVTEAQDVNVLKISTNGPSDNGDMYLTLTPPTELCQISSLISENVYHVKVRAYTFVNRYPVSDYCNQSGVTCDADLQEKSARPDCESYYNEWVKANGTGCSVLETNDSWKCLTNSPITLTSVNVNEVPSRECEIVIPSGDKNRIATPEGGENHVLYASLKRKKVEVTVNIRNALDGSTNVQVAGDYSLNETCSREDKPCTYKVLAGVPIVFSHNEFGEDEGNFRYWSYCHGDQCTQYNTSGDLELAFYDENDGKTNTVTAVYSKESQCYYEDFTNTIAFCGTDGIDCIDTCAVRPGDSQACMPKYGKQVMSNWLMTFTNKNDGNADRYEEPNIEDGYIYATTKQGKPSIILRNKIVGSNGTMFSLVQAGIVNNSDTRDLLNSGLVFRSNGQEHLILNIYGTSTSGKTGNLTFRVCKVEGQSISSATEGDCKLVPAKTGVLPLSIKNSTFIKVRLEIDNNDLLKVTAKVDDKTWEGEVNVRELGCNGADHKYVGLSLKDPDFKVFDNGWTSAALDDVCWEVPTVSCDFNDKKVALEEYVTPFVTLSTTWFEDKNCVKEFYYNGCDEESAPRACVGLGSPGEIGYKINGEQYKFTQVGLHGFDFDGKRTKEASVKMVCPGDAGSLDLAKDYYSCKEFTVGDPSYCTKDVDIYDDSKYLSAGEAEIFSVPGDEDSMNMLGADIHVHVEMEHGLGVGPLGNRALGANLTIQLEDADGVRSLARTISNAGVANISMEWITTSTIGFDPQRVSKIIITSDEGISIEKLSIHSRCSKKLDLKCENATLDLANNGWRIQINPQPAEVTCSYTSDDANLIPETDVTCSGVHPMTYSQGHEFDWLFMTDSTEFTVTATRKSASGKVLNSSSCKIKGMPPNTNPSLECEIINGTTSIPFGSKAPGVKFKFGDEKPGAHKVPYTVTLDGTVIEGNGSADLGKWQNVPADMTPTRVGTYTYVVNVGIGNVTPCKPSFTVSNPTGTVDCRVDSDGKFHVDIPKPEGISYNYTFAVTNQIGSVINEITGETGASDRAKLEFSPTLPADGKYGYAITIDVGGDKKNCLREFDYESKVSLKCPASITGQDPSNAISVGATAKGCEDGCTYKVGSNNPSNDLPYTFYDLSGTGTKDYTLEAVNDVTGKKATCPFKVTFLEELAVTCPTSDITGQKPEKISVDVDVSNCESCSYLINAITPTKAGNTFTFSDSDVSTNTKSKQYTFKATDKYGKSKECSFNVVFASGGGCKCTDYCTQSQCDELRVSGSLRFDGNCYFATSISNMNGTGYVVNGRTYGGYMSNGFGSTVDGGYYITSTGANYGSSVTLGVPTPGCAHYYTCTKKSCIPFVNGTGGYNQNCYSSGLSNHASGTCYTLQDGREDATNINNTATDTYWWKVVDCNDFCI
jgi:hypothetical protein